MNTMLHFFHDLEGKGFFWKKTLSWKKWNRVALERVRADIERGVWETVGVLFVTT